MFPLSDDEREEVLTRSSESLGRAGARGRELWGSRRSSVMLGGASGLEFQKCGLSQG